MICLINRVCYLPHRIERLLCEFGIMYKIVTEKEWYSQMLKKAGLIDMPACATCVITDLGKQVLAKGAD